MSDYKNFLSSLTVGQTVVIVRPRMTNDNNSVPSISEAVIVSKGKKFLTVGRSRFFKETGKEDNSNYAAWLMPSAEAAEEQFAIRKALSSLRLDIDNANRDIYESLYKDTPVPLTENITLEKIAEISVALKALSALRGDK